MITHYLNNETIFGYSLNGKLSRLPTHEVFKIGKDPNEIIIQGLKVISLMFKYRKFLVDKKIVTCAPTNSN